MQVRLKIHGHQRVSVASCVFVYMALLGWYLELFNDGRLALAQLPLKG